jgi:hypothetical protein
MSAENLPLPTRYRRRLSPLHPGLKMAKLGGVWTLAALLATPPVAWYTHRLPINSRSQCGNSSLPAALTVLLTSLILPAMLTCIILAIAALTAKPRDDSSGPTSDTPLGRVPTSASHYGQDVVSAANHNGSHEQAVPLLATVRLAEEHGESHSHGQGQKTSSRHPSVTSDNVPHLTADALELLRQLQAAKGGGGEDSLSKSGSIKRKTSGKRNGKLEAGGGGGMERHPSVRYSVRTSARAPGMTQSCSTAFPTGQGHRMSSTERPVFKKRDSRTSRNSLSVEDIEDETRYPPVPATAPVLSGGSRPHSWARDRTASIGTDGHVGGGGASDKIRAYTVSSGDPRRVSVESIRSTGSRSGIKVDSERRGSSVNALTSPRQSVISLRTSRKDDGEAEDVVSKLRERSRSSGHDIRRDGDAVAVSSEHRPTGSSVSASHAFGSPSRRNRSYIRSKSHDVTEQSLIKGKNNDITGPSCVRSKSDDVTARHRVSMDEAGHATASRADSGASKLVPRGPCADTVQPLMDGYNPDGVEWSCWSVPIDDTSVCVLTLTLGLTFLLVAPFYATLLACTLAPPSTDLEKVAMVMEWLSYAASLVHPLVQMTLYALKIRRIRQQQQAQVARQRAATAARRHTPQSL